MALTNIIREPRRELTEQALGLAVLAVPMYGDYRFATWFAQQTTDNTHPYGAMLVIGFVLGAILCVGLWAILIFMHYIGDEFADRLEARGWQVRPKDRR